MAYGVLIEKWNRSINLVSRGDIARLDKRHLIDSLAASPYLTGETVLDVGTGPGLPGIPLAIARPTLTFTLWERMSRRVRFLQLVCRELGLNNVEVVECDLDKTAHRKPLRFDHIVARAVAPMEQLWPSLQGHLTKNGSLIVYSHTSTQVQDDPSDFSNDLHASGAGRQRRAPTILQRQGLQLKQITYAVPGLGAKHHLQLVSNSATDS